jgi:hypothetical protein
MTLTTTYNRRTETGTLVHQATRTHNEIARQLGLPLTLVAIVREVLRGTSAQSGRALEECDGDSVRAAVWLAEHRQCYRIAGQITPDVVAQIARIDGREL